MFRHKFLQDLLTPPYLPPAALRHPEYNFPADLFFGNLTDIIHAYIVAYLSLSYFKSFYFMKRFSKKN
ncbi:hypothetical protein L1887_28537 [Cichorium endivia]|nr:hypothetical protein L1887_28537 [Cichorium endivia]